MPPIFWLIDVYIPNLKLIYGQLDFTGKLLIVSEQLWSILRGDEVRSMLIGPGFLLGKGTLKGYPIEIKEPLISVILDATELRPNQEIPLLDLMNPELLDPTSKADVSEIKIKINKIFKKYGQVFFQKKLAEIKEIGNIPISLGIDDTSEKINIKSFSGIDKIKFVLAGENNKLYTNFSKLIKLNKYNDKINMNILRSDTKEIKNIDNIKGLEDWIIVEKTTQLDIENGPSFIESILKEFKEINNQIMNNLKTYLV